MSALDGISEKQTYAVPVKFTVEFESEVLITATSTEDITSKTDDYIESNFDDMAGDVLAQSRKATLKEIKEDY